jgi:hypothetical protein
LKVTNGRELKALAQRDDGYAEALAGHTTRGKPGVKYERIG